jgi:TonB family protein
VFLLSASVLFAQEAPEKTARSAEPQDGIYEIGNGVTPPKSTYAPNAEYTDKARKKKINGNVIVKMVVMADGKVGDVKVIKSLEPGLDQQAVAAVKNWTFDPATKDGKPVAVYLKAEVSFRLY